MHHMYMFFHLCGSRVNLHVFMQSKSLLTHHTYVFLLYHLPLCCETQARSFWLTLFCVCWCARVLTDDTVLWQISHLYCSPEWADTCSLWCDSFVAMFLVIVYRNSIMGDIKLQSDVSLNFNKYMYSHTDFFLMIIVNLVLENRKLHFLIVWTTAKITYNDIHIYSTNSFSCVQNK